MSQKEIDKNLAPKSRKRVGDIDVMTMSRVDIVKQFGINSNDNGGSSESQIAILTKEIKEFKKHSDQHPKDNSSNRGLLRKVALRKKLLTYLKRTNLDSYMSILQKLGLRQ